MTYANRETLDAFAQFDSATIFNAVVESMGATQGGRELEGKGGMPENYTGPEIRALLPELGMAVGYAITSEVTTNDPDVIPLPWTDYYDVMAETPAPMIAVMKDVDSRPGRGATFGDGMAALHKALGATGAVVDGTVRDLTGIKDVGLPIWGRGLVPGHGVFSLIRINSPVTVGELEVRPDELLVADLNGCTKVPAGTDLGAVLDKAKEIIDRERERHAFLSKPGLTPAEIRDSLRRRR